MKLYVATAIASVFVFGIFTISNILESFQSEKIQNKHLNIFPQKGIYSTIWMARAKGINDLIRIADETEINTLVIDVKDSGVYLGDYIKNLVDELRQKNIYTVARMVVFQDDSQITNHPDWYFKKSDSALWQDEKKWYWLDPENREMWDFNVSIAKEAIDAGFDEINNEFSQYLTSELKKYDPDIKLSINIFAYSMLRTDDLKVGQKLGEKDLKKLRPWIQDFNIGAIYDSEMIRKEKQAVYDSGLTAGWLLWNPRNVYTESALDK